MRIRYILVAAVACVAIAFATVQLRRAPEPMYQGKRLGEWVLDWDPHEYPYVQNEGLRQAGTNAIPQLLKLMRYETPPWIWRLRDRAPRFVLAALRINRLTSGELLAYKSFFAFAALGTNGLVGVPGLVELMGDTNAPGAAYRAVECLRGLGTNGYIAVPVLAQMAQATNTRVAYTALHCLRSLGTNGLLPLVALMEDPRNPMRHAAITAVWLDYQSPAYTDAASSRVLGPVVLRYMADPSAQEGALEAAVVWLATVKYEPSVSVAVLCNIVTNAGASDRSRRIAMKALGNYRALAAGALPALTNALENPDISYAASNAIWRITTELATNTPAH